MADFCSFKRTTARKAHCCPECGSTIQPSDTYFKIAGYNSESDFFSAIQCVPCRAFSRRFKASLDCCDYLSDDQRFYHFGNVLDEAAEHLEYWRNAPKDDGWPARRDAMFRLFDKHDTANLLHQARNRMSRQRKSPKYFVALYGRALALGMASCSPSPLATNTTGGA